MFGTVSAYPFEDTNKRICYRLKPEAGSSKGSQGRKSAKLFHIFDGSEAGVQVSLYT